jgi:hypothetical protein
MIGIPFLMLCTVDRVTSRKEHSFPCDNPTSVPYSMYDGQPVTTKDLKKVALPNHEETLQNAAPVALPAPGMKDIKRMELWVKWRPLIPVELRKD